jgi:hypothetical protein
MLSNSSARQTLMTRSRAAVTVVLVLLVSCWALPRLPDGVPEQPQSIPSQPWKFLRWLQSRNGPATSSMKPREVTLVNRSGDMTRLLVPAAYVDRGGGWELIVSGTSDHPGGFVTLQAYLPELLPKLIAEQMGYKVHGPVRLGIYLASEDMVSIRISPANAFNWERHVQWTKERYTYERDADGYAIYYETLHLQNTGSWRSKEVLIPIGDPEVVIECALSQTRERLGCNVEVPSDGVVQLNFMIWSTHLVERHEIEAKVRALVDSFVTR